MLKKFASSAVATCILVTVAWGVTTAILATVAWGAIAMRNYHQTAAPGVLVDEMTDYEWLQTKGIVDRQLD